MTKSLGQVAYDAFGGAIKRDPPWSKLWVQERKWWQAAAEAVVKQHMMELTGADDYQWGTFELDADGAVISQDSGTTPRNILPGQRAVIEAAKALGIIRLLADARDGRDFTTEQCRALRDFEGAVDALQEVEDGNA